MESVNPAAKTIPEALFMLYQMTFAIITVALVAGAVADRMRFSAYLLFSVGWFTFVYVPLAHWVWGGGFLATTGVLDFAGGLVVHLSAGIGGLVAATVIGRRHGYGSENLAPFDLSLAVIGTGMLWVGWFGFNGGSALERELARGDGDHREASGRLRRRTDLGRDRMGDTAQAVGARHDIGCRRGTWHHHAGLRIRGALARRHHRRDRGHALFLGLTSLKQRFKYDDSLDVFGVHGVGGLTGTLLAGVFAVNAIGGTAGLVEGNPQQVLIQLYGVAVTLLWSGGITFVLLKLVGVFAPLRVSSQQELEGLDISQHGEALQ